MSRIPDEIIEQVRDAADIVAIIGESVELKRTGTDYRGPCPFHGGTHRNFAVVPRKGMYHCFVCHEAGDVFKYLQKRYGMDWPSAVRQVAAKVGVVIPENTERHEPDVREPLFSAVAVAHDWFQRQLREAPDAEAARKYLLGRDIPLETAGELGLGWAPPGNAFLEEMKKLGIAPQVLRDAGLLVERDDGTTGPRFRKRLIIPIHDLRGRVVAFGGRVIGDGEPKYLNSPESELFHKGHQLYNLHLAKNAIRKEEFAVVVEGYFDTLRLVLGGVENVVAPLGTSLTPDQAKLLTRYTKQVVICYDNDGPGLKAAFRAADECLRAGLRTRVATLPDGQDPDDLMRQQGAKAVRQVLHDAMDVLERKIDMLEKKEWFTNVERRREALDRLLPTIRATKDPIQRDLYLDRVREKTGVGLDTLKEELARAGSRYGGPPPSDDRGPPPPSMEEQAPQRQEQAARPAKHKFAEERQFLTVLLADAEWVSRAKQDVSPDLFRGKSTREIYAALLEGRSGTLPEGLGSDAQMVWSELKESGGRFTKDGIGDSYEAARESLALMPHLRKDAELLESIERAGSEDEKEALIRTRKDLRDQIAKTYPNAWARHIKARKQK
jgi:DNA primase